MNEEDSRSRTARVEPANVRGASEEVAMQIQHYIQREGLAPGDFLGREGDLAEQFGISRPTLREGLRLLSSGNLVRASKGPGGGIFVAHTAEDGMSRSLSEAISVMVETGAVTLEELLDARLLLEVPLAGRAAQEVDACNPGCPARGGAGGGCGAVRLSAAGGGLRRRDPQNHRLRSR